MNNEVRLTLEGGGSPERLADFTRELSAELTRESDLRVQDAVRAADADERAAGVPLLGQLALTFLSAGAATALINCMRAFLERDRSLRFRLKKSDGTEIEVEGKHLRVDQLEDTLRTVKEFVA